MSVLIRSDWCDIVLEPAVCMLPADRVSAVTEWIAVCSEVTLAFLVFHRAGTITVDQASLALRCRCQQHFLNDFRQGGGMRLHSASQGVAAEGAEAHHLVLDLLVRRNRHAI